MNLKNTLRSISLLLALTLTVGHAVAGSNYTTAGPGLNQSWSAPATWTADSSYPGSNAGNPFSVEGDGDTAELSAVNTPSSLTLDGNTYEIGGLTIDDGGTAPWTIANGTLEIFALAGGITDNSSVGGNVIASNISITGFGLGLGNFNLDVSTKVETTISGAISDGGSFSIGSLTVNGPGTLVLSGANTYSGGTNIQSGTLDLDASTGNLAGGSNLTFAGTGTFNYDNTTVEAGTNSAQTLALAFNTGDGTVVNTLGTAGGTTSTLTFSGATRSTGATGNFVTSGGTNGLDNLIVITGQATGFMDPGLFFNGSNYATYDAGGFVRGINYGTDADSVVSTNDTNGMTGALTSASNVLLSEDITNQTSTQVNTLNMANHNLGLAADQTLTTNGILESGGTATISGGDGIAYGGFGSESDLVVRTDQASDVLTISTAVTAPNLTKSGAGTLNLNGGAALTGTAYVNNGTLNVGSGSTVTGNVVAIGGTIGGGGTVNGSITVGRGGSTYPGDPQILTANTVEYQDGSTAQFSIASASGSSHPPTAGAGGDYDRMNLIAGSGTALTVDSGTTTLQLNMDTATLDYLVATAASQTLAGTGNFDDYFLFTLGSATSSGEFTNLTLVDGANTYTETIVNGAAAFDQLGLDFNVSYTGIAATDSLTGGNDVVITVVPEPGTWALMAGGLILLVAYQRRLKVKASA